MRHIKTAFGLSAAVCALGVTAVSASAKEFNAERVGKTFSEAEPGRTKGKSQGTLAFKLGPFTIECEGASAKGAVTSAFSPTLFAQVHYNHCQTLAKFGNQTAGIPTRFITPVDFEYHQNGIVESGSENEEEVTITGGEVSLRIAGIQCQVNWPSQTFPVKIKKGETEFSDGTYKN